MLRAEQNKFAVETGPGTPMGNLFRRYWIPAMHASELPENECPPVRIKLMSILLTAESGEVCTCDLAAAVRLSEPTVSHHLGQLKKAGMVRPERRGMNVYYRAHTDALQALRQVLDPSCCR